MRKARLLSLLDEIDLFIAPSRDLRDRFVAWGVPAERISIIPNSVPVARKSAQEPRAQPDRFAYFGNLADHKGVKVLLKASALLARREVDLRVTLYGRLNHPSKQAEQNFNDALAVAAPLAQYVGPYDRSEVQDLMALVDWVVLPSIWFENAPLVLLEARRAGRPVICTALGGMQEMVRDSIDGFLVPRNDPAALAEKMAAVSKDPRQWARLAKNIRQPPDMNVSARRHLEHYHSLHEGMLA